jgi:putative oxidoreductase
MQDAGKLLLRLTTAGLILFHGMDKLIHGLGFVEGALAEHHLPAFLAYGVYLGELAAPLFIIAGLWARIASLVVVLNMASAVFLDAHRNTFVIFDTGAWGLEAEAFFLLTALVVFLIGAGRYRIGRGEGIWE